MVMLGNLSIWYLKVKQALTWGIGQYLCLQIMLKPALYLQTCKNWPVKVL